MKADGFLIKFQIISLKNNLKMKNSTVVWLALIVLFIIFFSIYISIQYIKKNSENRKSQKLLAFTNNEIQHIRQNEQYYRNKGLIHSDVNL